MKLLVLSAIFAVAFSSSLPFDPELNDHWENFKRIYGKHYTGTEEGARRLVWEGNVREIMNHNLAADMALHSYTKGINEYSDLSHHEFVSRMNGFKMPSNFRKTNGSSFLPPSNVEYPDTVDWREGGFVTSVKNQLDCGGCWAFSATGSLEGQHKKKTGDLVSLSEQNLIDCSRSEGNKGCDGGIMDFAFIYIQKNGGIDTEESYPYEGKDDVCRFRRDTVGATCSGYVDLPQGDEDSLMKAVATVGPISVGIDAGSRNFMEYKSGVYDDSNCDPSKLNHAVLVIGYGREGGKDYWLVKNSWGESWGLNGYVKMSRNKQNQCGIASIPSYPLV